MSTSYLGFVGVCLFLPMWYTSLNRPKGLFGHERHPEDRIGPAAYTLQGNEGNIRERIYTFFVPAHFVRGPCRFGGFACSGVFCGFSPFLCAVRCLESFCHVFCRVWRHACPPWLCGGGHPVCMRAQPKPSRLGHGARCGRRLAAHRGGYVGLFSARSVSAGIAGPFGRHRSGVVHRHSPDRPASGPRCRPCQHHAGSTGYPSCDSVRAACGQYHQGLLGTPAHAAGRQPPGSLLLPLVAMGHTAERASHGYRGGCRRIQVLPLCPYRQRFHHASAGTDPLSETAAAKVPKGIGDLWLCVDCRSGAFPHYAWRPLPDRYGGGLFDWVSECVSALRCHIPAPQKNKVIKLPLFLAKQGFPVRKPCFFRIFVRFLLIYKPFFLNRSARVVITSRFCPKSKLLFWAICPLTGLEKSV